MRGTKLLADRLPPLFAGEIKSPEGSMVGYMQTRLREAVYNALAAVASDVRKGLLETVGLESEWWTDDPERASVVITLPEGVDAESIARAVDLENLEAWAGAEGRLHVAIGAYYSTKDVDQVVLCAIKVLHEYTGLLDVDPNHHAHQSD